VGKLNKSQNTQQQYIGNIFSLSALKAFVERYNQDNKNALFFDSKNHKTHQIRA